MLQQQQQPPQLNFSFRKWFAKLVQFILSTINFVVFTFLDLLDFLLCIFYRFFDPFMEPAVTVPQTTTHTPPYYCYCYSYSSYCLCLGGNNTTTTTTTTTTTVQQVEEIDDEQQPISSETLYQRQNVFRDFTLFIRKQFFNHSNTQLPNSINNNNNNNKSAASSKIRWSDCNCQSCASCHHIHIGNNRDGDHFNNLHLVVMEQQQQPLQATHEHDYMVKPVENVIFLHGFLSSSSFWVESTFPNLSQTAKHNYRLFAVDLLGFGKSPKPWDCLYTLKDHVNMIEQSLINPFSLNSFHIVAHSMGCIIALALASKYLNSVKSITLVAAVSISILLQITSQHVYYLVLHKHCQ
ncbi:hypothetical protein AQUCO_00900012v1 [Aquilegia coerulea]|uniref:AB hydrolase-1 domain-containing protein n=1 Tax=Aquilegia coerulea TaxID=218851 RepID=A0A2G5EBG6_AQUCA|nr:hypothetical protein AQUCO_00900012v1 [Aquilegia coerulea]